MDSFDLNNLVRPNILTMQPYSSARDEFMEDGQEMIFLDANESPYENGVNRYPDPQQRDLKALIATQKDIDPSQILLGNGSDEILDLIFRAFCNPGKDNVISLPPTYGMYNVLSTTNDIENREVVLDTFFQPIVQGILNVADEHTKLIFFCSPNNPTGNLIDPKRIEEVLNHFSGLVVIDEAYIDFAQSASWITRLAEFPNLIVTQTLSKAYGLAGIRLGVCFASWEIIGILNKIKPPYNVNKLTQIKAHDHLKKMETIKKGIRDIISSRDNLIKVLLEVTFVTEVVPTDANFVLVRVDNAYKRYQELLSEGIVVRNRSSQPRCENTLRFTVGTSAECKELVRILKKIN